jgi:CBS domain containing-hemolysin-like protein
MVPRPEVDFLTTDTNLTYAIGASVRTGHTRLPLCEPGGLDAVVGILNAKDLLPVVHEDREIELSEVARSVLRLPESTRVDELLRRLRGERQHLAVLEDEHGTTVGIVTLEDVLEEIVGEIEDEFDPQAADRRATTSWSTAARRSGSLPSDSA